ncbi:peptidylprolyl isomerase [candidate division KSB1 bacterium]|nr:peptidylprolyl isomerase [candidate division KSB1 bacterium]
MKRIGKIIFSTIFILLTMLSGQELLDRIVAVVDDEIVLESEVTQMAWMMAAQMGVDPARDQTKFAEFRKIAANNIVTKELLVIQADKDTINADEQQIETYLNQQMQMATQQAGGEEKLEQIFGMTISRIRRNYRDDIEKELRANAVQEQKLANVTVNRREVREFYNTMKDSLGRINDTVDISHILVETQPGEKARMEAMEKAIQIRKELLDGADFAELAKQSADPGSAQRGGDLGFMSRDEFVKEYAEAAFSLQPGELSDIVESQFGFHIIKLEDKRGEKIHTRHILISITPTREDEIAAAARIKDIHRQLQDGADFVALVEEFSDDESTKNDRGHLGVYEVEQLRSMAKEFIFALEGVEVGGISDPVKTQYGFHILKLNSREQAREIDLDKDYDRIEALALNYKKQKELEKWLEQMKRQVYIEYKDKSLL